MINSKLKALSAALILAGTSVAATNAEARYRGYYYPHGGYYGHHHHGGWGNGGAAAAGLVGGLALGALASHAYNPGYYGRPTYGAYGSYGAYGGCYVARQRVIDDWGYAHWRRVRVCN